jgi:hypothetical protein
MVLVRNCRVQFLKKSTQIELIHIQRHLTRHSALILQEERVGVRSCPMKSYYQLPILIKAPSTKVIQVARARLLACSLVLSRQIKPSFTN